MKISRISFFAFCVILCMAGCGISDNDNYKLINDTDSASISHDISDSGDGDAVTKMEEDNDVSEQAEKRLEAGITDEAIQDIVNRQQGRYCFDYLDDNQKKIYAELLIIINNELDDVMVSTGDSDELSYIYRCLINDHPELFWIDGYTYTRHIFNGQIEYLTFGGRYTYTDNKRIEKQKIVDKYVEECLSGMDLDASSYQKVKYVYEYLILNTEYDLMSSDNQNILSVFENRKSVCQGYAKATQYILQKLDIPCAIVEGYAVTGEGHAWNLVNIDGSYYYLDTTWGDTEYTGDVIKEDMGINYNFLNITTEELLKTHVISNIVALPQCIATDCNYYIYENLYFESYDSDRIKEAFNKAYDKGEKLVTFKCSDKEVYDTMLKNLIEKQKVFDYLMTESLSYAASENDLTISMWL